jgi:hypothetical protein
MEERKKKRVSQKYKNALLGHPPVMNRHQKSRKIKDFGNGSSKGTFVPPKPFSFIQWLICCISLLFKPQYLKTAFLVFRHYLLANFQ